MSHSSTYRSASLSSAQLQELARIARENRFRDEILPLLRQNTQQQLHAVTALGQASGLLQARFEDRLSSATTSGELRLLTMDLATQLPEAPRPAPSGPTSLLSNQTNLPASSLTVPNMPAAKNVHAELAGATFDLIELSSEYASLQRTAAGLGLSFDTDQATRVSLDAVSAALGLNNLRLAEGALAEAKARLRALDEIVDSALNEAESVCRTTESVIATLQDMGFTVNSSDSDQTSTVILARRGQTDAQVEVADADGTVNCQVDFFDLADAVPLDDSAAEELCDPAIELSMEFHTRWAQRKDIELGKVHAVDRPTRGSSAKKRSTVSRITRRQTTSNQSTPRRIR
jgi:hypothetical protein